MKYVWFLPEDVQAKISARNWVVAGWVFLAVVGGANAAVAAFFIVQHVMADTSETNLIMWAGIFFLGLLIINLCLVVPRKLYRKYRAAKLSKRFDTLNKMLAYSDLAPLTLTREQTRQLVSRSKLIVGDWILTVEPEGTDKMVVLAAPRLQPPTDDEETRTEQEL